MRTCGVPVDVVIQASVWGRSRSNSGSSGSGGKSDSQQLACLIHLRLCIFDAVHSADTHSAWQQSSTSGRVALVSRQRRGRIR